MRLNKISKRKNQSIEKKKIDIKRGIAEYSGKIKIVFFVKRETLCDSAVTN